MSKNTKRQRKLEDMMGSSSTKKKKGNTDYTSNVDKQNVVHTPKTTSTVTKKISDDDLDYLKHFDLDMSFGPCTGITRLDRYERALRHELDPPTHVLELINLHPNDRQVTHCIWRDYQL